MLERHMNSQRRSMYDNKKKKILKWSNLITKGYCENLIAFDPAVF